MKQSGTELEKRSRSNPYPKKADSDFEHHLDIIKQNDWLRSNVFVSLGKYSVLHTHYHYYHPLTQYIHVLTNTLSHSHTHRQLPLARIVSRLPIEYTMTD